MGRCSRVGVEWWSGRRRWIGWSTNTPLRRLSSIYHLLPSHAPTPYHSTPPSLLLNLLAPLLASPLLTAASTQSLLPPPPSPTHSRSSSGETMPGCAPPALSAVASRTTTSCGVGCSSLPAASLFPSPVLLVVTSKLLPLPASLGSPFDGLRDDQSAAAAAAFVDAERAQRLNTADILSIRCCGVCWCRYWVYLIPLSLPVVLLTVFGHWLGLHMFRHN